MTWSSTVKDFKSSTVFKEIPGIVKRFYGMLIVMTVVLAGIIISTTSLVPLPWRVRDFSALFCPILFTSFQ